MKVYIKFKFSERYYPTSQSKSYDFRWVESSTLVSIKECKEQDAPIVMVVKKGYHSEAIQIRAYKGKLYRNMERFCKGEVRKLWKNATVEMLDSYWECPEFHYGDMGEKKGRAHIRAYAKKLLVIEGKVFEPTSEPVYYTEFTPNGYAGQLMLGYLDSAKPSWWGCFSALEREEAEAELEEMLVYCTEIDNLIGNKNIEVIDPEYVKFNRKAAK